MLLQTVLLALAAGVSARKTLGKPNSKCIVPDSNSFWATIKSELAKVPTQGTTVDGINALETLGNSENAPCHALKAMLNLVPGYHLLSWSSHAAKGVDQGGIIPGSYEDHVRELQEAAKVDQEKEARAELLDGATLEWNEDTRHWEMHYEGGKWRWRSALRWTAWQKWEDAVSSLNKLLTCNCRRCTNTRLEQEAPDLEGPPPDTAKCDGYCLPHLLPRRTCKCLVGDTTFIKLPDNKYGIAWPADWRTVDQVLEDCKNVPDNDQTERRRCDYNIDRFLRLKLASKICHGECERLDERRCFCFAYTAKTSTGRPVSIGPFTKLPGGKYVRSEGSDIDKTALEYAVQGAPSNTAPPSNLGPLLITNASVPSPPEPEPDCQEPCQQLGRGVTVFDEIVTEGKGIFGCCTHEPGPTT